MAAEGTKVQEGDVVVLNRDYTTYLYYNMEKYFVIEDEKWIRARIIERDE